MLKIKLTPFGKKDHRYYRLAVMNCRSKLKGDNLDLLGTYNPHDPENKINIDLPRYQSWLKKGAQPTDTIKNLVAKIK